MSTDQWQMGRVVRHISQATFTTPVGPVTDPVLHAIPLDSRVAACGVTTGVRIGVPWRLRSNGTAPICSDCVERVG